MIKATHIYHNGHILTMDARCSLADSIAIAGDTIIGVGSAEDMRAFHDEGTQYTDLRRRTMLPGFYDAHSHFMRAGLYDALYVNLSAPPVGPVSTMADIRERIRAKAAALPKGEWIMAVSFDDTAIAEQRYFTLAEMDAMAPEHPLFIRHISGHLGQVNSAACALAGLTRETPDPPGGCLRRDAQGELSGILEEPAAMDLAAKAMPATTLEEWVAAAQRASTMYAARGVTTAHDGGVTDGIWAGAFEAHRRGALRVRLHLLPRHGSLDAVRTGGRTQAGTPLTADGLLCLGAAKLFHDGSLQGYTGYLTNPYHRMVCDMPGGAFWRGYPIYPQHELNDIVSGYHKKGWQIAIHGNGDAAIDEILEAFEQAQKLYPRADCRHTIIHCQTVREDQLDRIKRLGVFVSFFVVHTYYWGDRHRDIFLGPERARRISPLHSARRRAMPFSLHNDTPVTPIDPLLSVWSAVNRVTGSGMFLGPEQTVSVQDALRGVTLWAAFQHHEDHAKGSLEPGKLADLVILEENPLTVDPARIKDISIVATLVGNRLVHGALP